MNEQEFTATMDEFARLHREIADVFDWLSSTFQNIGSLPGPLPGETINGPHGWSCLASKHALHVNIYLKAPTPRHAAAFITVEQAKILMPQGHLPNFMSLGPNQSVIMVRY